MDDEFSKKGFWECIEALKVFNNCYDVVKFNECDPLPSDCLPLPSSYSITCDLSNVQCQVIAVQPTGGNLANVWFEITWDKTITIWDTSVTPSVVHCTISTSHSTVEIVSLWAPPGFNMLYQCEVSDSSCGTCTTAVINGVQSVCCEADFCLDIQAKYPVKLMVWTKGYCEQTECDPKVTTQTVECPPEPPFPPQPMPPPTVL